MFGAKHGGAAAYTQVGLETGVQAANPHKLIVMLFDGALQAVRGAREHMKAADIEAKGKSVSHATSIITSGLRASLDLSKGGEIASNLDALYDYMVRRLMHAHLHNDFAALDEVERLLGELREAWSAIGESAAPAAVPASVPAAPALLDPLAPRAVSFVSA
jgi:flagellar secretion chaperone FliS